MDGAIEIVDSAAPQARSSPPSATASADAPAPASQPSRLATLKDLASIAQAIATIVAIIVGGIWSYRLFVKERRDYPHANIQQVVSHIPLGPELNLLRVGVVAKNTGSTRVELKNATVRIQQILPLTGCGDPGVCATTEIAADKNEIDRRSDRFPWPTIGERITTFETLREIEPTETDFFEVEFVVPVHVKTIRVYSYVRNEHKPHLQSEIGWSMSDYYTFANTGGSSR